MAKCEQCGCCDAALQIEEDAYWRGAEERYKYIIRALEENCFCDVDYRCELENVIEEIRKVCK